VYLLTISHLSWNDIFLVTYQSTGILLSIHYVLSQNFC